MDDSILDDDDVEVNVPVNVGRRQIFGSAYSASTAVTSSTVIEPQRTTMHPLLYPQDEGETQSFSRSILEESSASCTSRSSYIRMNIHSTGDDDASAGNTLNRTTTPPPFSLDNGEDEDNHSNCETADGLGTTKSSSQRQLPSPTLRSLRTKKLPPLAEEQDRKRFVGCLAAVLASAYDYDLMDENENMEEALRAESMAYLSFSEHDSGQGDDDEEDGLDSLYTQQAAGSSFDYSDTATSNERQRQQRGRDNNNNNMRSTNTGGCIGASMPYYRRSDAVSKARNRHWKRRYDVLSQLLLSSAELLQLEKGQARAFLPMLAKLLMPEQQQQKKNQQQPHRNTSTKKTTTFTASATQKQSFQTRDFATEDPDMNSAAAVHSFSLGSKRTTENRKKKAEFDFVQDQINSIEHLGPFLESMTPGSGFRCLAVFLLQHLLNSQEGYDARVRHAIKTLGVLVLIHDMDHDDDHDDEDDDEGNHNQKCEERVTLATRKFESLEHHIATQLMLLSREQERAFANGGGGGGRSSASSSSRALVASNTSTSKEQILRGLKIGGTAVVAGTLFAVTGGLAAPGIAAGVAAFAGGTMATAAAAAVLTSTAAVTAIFGVGGGSLAAYKMQRRVAGLTEFRFRKESRKPGTTTSKEEDVDLFSTIVISGWLRDRYDFQRPWGVSPTNPRLTDRLELLERFYAVYRPDHVSKCRKVLQSWEGEEKQLWEILRQKYGRDPDHLFPLTDGPRLQGKLTLEQAEIVDQLFIELGYIEAPSHEARQQSTPFERMRWGWNNRGKEQSKVPPSPPRAPDRPNTHQHHVTMQDDFDSLHGPRAVDTVYLGPTETSSVASSGFDSVSTAASAPVEAKEDSNFPKHLTTVWDYEANYGGELYTVKWESELLTELCDSVSDLAFDLVSGGTAQLLKHTALSTLMSAIAWPYALVNAANLIDGTWTLAVERSDEAGKELARSLLFSRAGHRPVTLVGYSFGARAIYFCLKELARYQEKWEVFQEGNTNSLDEGRDFYKQMREPASIVEDVILLGLPNHLSISSWKACRQVVAGRLVNCFSQKDLILSLMFQLKRLGLKPVCGTCPVNVNGVENIDVTDLVSGHQDYCLVMGDILKRVRHGQPFWSRPTRLMLPVVVGPSTNAADRIEG